ATVGSRAARTFLLYLFFFFSSRRRHTRSKRDWSSDVCSSDLFDVVGPLPVSSKGNSYVLVAQDAFSKWPEAKAVASCPTTQVIIDWLQDAIICRFGKPKEIMTDRGSQLESRDCIDWKKSASITNMLSTTYHHQTNCVVERFNGTLEGRLRTAAESANDWDAVLEKSLHAYRTTAHSVTKRSPFEILH